MDLSYAGALPPPEPLLPEYRYTDVRNHGDGIVFKRHMFEWMLPADCGPHLKFNPRQLPVVQTQVVIRATFVQIWELWDILDADRRVYSVGKTNEDYYLRIAIARIDNGFLGSQAIPIVSFV